MYGIFLDIETNGLDASLHAPLEIACKIIDLSIGHLQGEYQSMIKQPQAVWDARDPGSIEVNGYTWEMVSLGKEVALIQQEIIALFTQLNIKRGAAVFICQNPSFDRSFFNQLVRVYTQEGLQWPYHWLDLASMYWTKLVEKMLQEGKALPENISVSKNEIAKAYHLAPEASPHRAMQGVDHLLLCYQAVLGVCFVL